MFVKKKILIIASQQPSNQYAGGGAGVEDSEQFWMRKLAEETVALLVPTGHDVRLGPTGTPSSTYAENVKWANAAENRDADLLISLHSNATSTVGDHAVGIGVYHHPNSPKGKEFALKLLPFVAAASATGKAYVSTITVAEVASTRPPALLVENEFHDHSDSSPGGADWIREPVNRTRLARAYRDFIVSMWGSAEVPTTTTTTTVRPTTTTTTTAKPTTTTTTTKRSTSAVKLAEINALDERFGIPFSTKRRDGIVSAIKKSGATMVAFSELPEKARNKVRAKLPGGTARWLVWVNGAVGLLWDSRVWEHMSLADVQTPDFNSYHGAVVAQFRNRASKKLYVFGSYHLTPNTNSSTTAQKAQAKEVVAAARKLKGFRIIAGDGADAPGWFVGWLDARSGARASTTRNRPTYKKGKGSVTDRVAVDKSNADPFVILSYEVLETQSASDHNLVVVEVEVEG